MIMLKLDDSFANENPSENIQPSSDSPNQTDQLSVQLPLSDRFNSSISEIVDSECDKQDDHDEENRRNVIIERSDESKDSSTIMCSGVLSDVCEPRICFNMGFSWRLKCLEYKALYAQYQLACLSTLGGAYHLINSPKAALSTALQQERVAAVLGSSALLVRARVFQATNYHLLGLPKRARRAFIECKLLVQQYGMREDSSAFIFASEEWCRRNTQASNPSVS